MPSDPRPPDELDELTGVRGADLGDVPGWVWLWIVCVWLLGLAAIAAIVGTLS